MPGAPGEESAADAGNEGIVHARVTEGARDADPREGVALTHASHHPLHADDRIQLEQRECRRGAVEVYCSGLERGNQ